MILQPMHQAANVATYSKPKPSRGHCPVQRWMAAPAVVVGYHLFQRFFRKG